MDKFTIKEKMIEFYPSWEKYILEAKQEEKKVEQRKISIPKSQKIEDYGIVYTKDGDPIEMGHLKREIESAKTAIVSQSPLFAPYVHHFVPIYTWLVPTMATDGTRVFINPAFANKLTWNQKIFVLIHEIMHCVLLHMERIKGRDAKIFNIAGDFEINTIIVDTLSDRGFTEAFMEELGGLYDKKYLNLPVENIYEDIKKNMPPMSPNPNAQGNQGSGQGVKGQPGQGGGQPGEGEPGEGQPGDGVGGAGDPGSESVYRQMADSDPAGTGGIISEEQGKKIAKESGYGKDEIGPDESAKDKWNVESGKMLDKMEKSKQYGSGKGNALLKTLQSLHRGDVNWKRLFRKYVATALSPEKIWKLGSKKHLGKEYIKRGEKQKYDAIKKIVVMVDVSGSMSQKTLEKILGEINEIIFAKKVKEIVVGFFDDGVDEKSVQTIKRHGNRPWIPKNVSGGGGTSFQKPLDWIHENLKDRITLCVFFTDGYAPMPTKPRYASKFIWLVYDNPGFEKPFGKVINLSAQE